MSKLGTDQQPHDGQHQRPDPRSSEPHDPCPLCEGIYPDEFVAKIIAADLVTKPMTVEAFKAWLADIEPDGSGCRT